MTRRAVTATVLYVAIAAVYLSQSGAPPRVHAATLTSLAVGFLIPALVVGSISEFARRWKLVLMMACAGAVVFGALTSLVVVKAAFLEWWYVKYPILVVGMAALVLVHAALTGLEPRSRSAA